MISLDTNILIDNPEIVFDDTRQFCLSFTVIRELDKLKRYPDLKRAAQSAIKNIWYQYEKDLITILNIPTTLGESPDEKIIQDTKDANSSILSEDIGARIIAKAHGVEVSNFEAESRFDPDYKGYITIDGDVNYEKHYVALKELQLEEFNTAFDVDLQHNQYCIIERIGAKNDIWKRKGNTVVSVSQSAKPLKDADIMVTPMDDVQQCALDAVMDPTIPLTIIDGTLGTGKTVLALMGALATTMGQKRFMHYERILVTKPPVSINQNLYTGYKPGTSEEKLSGHLAGFKSNLKFLLDRNSRKTLKPGESEELKSDTVWTQLFEVVEIDEIQGASIHDTIFLIDEWQLLDEESTKLVLSRISEGAKMVLIGDTLGQTYGMNRANEGFKVLYEYLGTEPDFSYIKLEEIYRSRLAKLVDKIFK